MCRTPALAATVLALLAFPALAAEPAKSGATEASAGRPAAKASAQLRTEARRLDALGRAAFWARELEIDGRDVEAGVGMSQALRQMGRNDEAADAIGAVLIMAPDNVDALLESARAQIGRGQGFFAIEPAKKAQALAPKDWRPLSLLAVALEQTGRDQEALAYHLQAMALAPNDPGPTTNAALYYAGHGDLPKAEQMLRIAAGSGRADARVRLNLALIIGLQGRVSEAEQLVRMDLPPEQAANNVAWLKAATERRPTGQARSWNAVAGAGS